MSTIVCGGCGHLVPALEPRPFRCPHAADDVDHVLVRHLADADADSFADSEPNPFVRYRRLTHAWQTAATLGMTDGELVSLVRSLDARVEEIDGRGFIETPLRHESNGSGGALWIKDETVNVGGSHKGRHLMGLAIWLEVAGRIDPTLNDARLAIASCGNAALAAAIVARAASRALDVFVPDDVSPAIAARLESLGAKVTRCARLPGTQGDPAYLRFRQAVAGGALPFTCQGSENGLVIEGGQTLGWELASQLSARGATLDRLFIQVGGGALASACIAALEEAHALGVLKRMPRIHAVQTLASPLQRAWSRLDGSSLDDAVAHRSRFMWPWEPAPRSLATGILDDETYDWVAVVRGMAASGGAPIVVSEERLQQAVQVAGVNVSATGAAGLAGLLELQARGEIDPRESVGVLFTG